MRPTPICDAIAQLKRAMMLSGMSPTRIVMGPDVYKAFARELRGDANVKITTFYDMHVECPDDAVRGQFVIA